MSPDGCPPASPNSGSRGFRRRGRTYARGRACSAALELQALRLETAADLRRVAERRAADGAVRLEHPMAAGHLLADEALVERAGVDVGAARRTGDVALAHPRAGRDGGDRLPHQIGVHDLLLSFRSSAADVMAEPAARGPASVNWSGLGTES